MHAKLTRALLFVCLAVVLILGFASVAMAAPPSPSSPLANATVQHNAPNGWYPHFEWYRGGSLYLQSDTKYWIVVKENNATVFTSPVISWELTSCSYATTSFYFTPGTYQWVVYEQGTYLDTYGDPSITVTSHSAGVFFAVPKPQMNLSPTSLAFTATQGGSNPPAQTLNLGCVCPGGMDPGPSWQTFNELLPSWVTESQVSSSVCSYSVNIAGLAPGTYKTSLKVRMWTGAFPFGTGSFDVTGSPYDLPITLTVLPAAAPGAPQVNSLTPDHGQAGASVTIAGSGFGDTRGTSSVTFGPTKAVVSAWSATSITCTVPATASGATTVAVTVAGKSSNGMSFTVEAGGSTPTATPTLALKLSGLTAGALRLGRRVTTRCIVTPTSLAGEACKLVVQKMKGTRWVKVAGVTGTIGSTGTYGWKYKPATRGSYRVQAKLAATAQHAAAKTPWRGFKAK